MKQYLIRGKRIVTVSDKKTIADGALAIKDGKIIDVGRWQDVSERFRPWTVIDCKEATITPALVDCHTHLLEFAPPALFPVTKETHLLKGKALLLDSLSAGITALGEQLCGSPNAHFSIDEFKKAVVDIPMDVSFAATSISIGFQELAHFTSVTKTLRVTKQQLMSEYVIEQLIEHSDYPGENLFLNATPANFLETDVPRAGELIYSEDELKTITEKFHANDKKIGVHVAGKEGIDLALRANVDVIHHAHGITKEQMKEVAKRNIPIVATPIGGTHLRPNSPEDIVQLVTNGIDVSISTDGFLPPHKDATWLPYSDRRLKGPEELMRISHLPMKRLKHFGLDENEILALLTKNPAKILGKAARFGSLEIGKEANFLVADGIPGLEITDKTKIKQVYVRGKKVIDRR